MVEVRFKPSLVGTVEDGAITNAKINATAGIEKSKLASLEIVNADIATGAAIAKAKLASLEIVNADVATGAAITKAKLESLAIVDADISAVSQSKVTDLVTALGAKVSTGPLSGNKKVTAIGWDSATGEVIVDHET